jgi:hypothetical protein
MSSKDVFHGRGVAGVEVSGKIAIHLHYFKFIPAKTKSPAVGDL